MFSKNLQNYQHFDSLVTCQSLRLTLGYCASCIVDAPSTAQYALCIVALLDAALTHYSIPRFLTRFVREPWVCPKILGLIIHLMVNKLLHIKYLY